MLLQNNNYIIGVDGGGTKTVAALADLKRKILKLGESGSSSPTNVGIKKATENVAKAIKKILPKRGKILLTLIGLPAVKERPELIKKVKKELLKKEEISVISRGKLEIVSDQVVAFRSGTDEKFGVILISGTGCVSHGWRKEKEAHASGWGWLADEGSGFWVGQKVYQAIWKDLDSRGPKTLLTELVFKKFKIKQKKDLINLVYLKNPILIVPQFSKVCDQAAQKGDEIARNIMDESGRELALAAITVIKKLNFQKNRFPLVLVGSTFRSKIIVNALKKEIKKLAPQAEFIQPKPEPIIGAIKLALEQIHNYGKTH